LTVILNRNFEFFRCGRGTTADYSQRRSQKYNRLQRYETRIADILWRNEVPVRTASHV